MEIFTGDTIIKILGVGISGFGFLLMYFAFQLVKQIVVTNEPSRGVVSIVSIYMILSFLMTVVVGYFTFITAVYKNNKINEQASIISEKSTKLNLFAAAQRSNAIKDSLLHNIGSPRPSLIAKQKQSLDSLSFYVGKTEDTSLISSFSAYRNSAIDFSKANFLNKQTNPFVTESYLNSLRKNYTISEAKFSQSVSDYSLK